MADKTLICKDCGQDFVFTAGEQEFYAEKGFENEPTRCPDCRRARKQQRGGRPSAGRRNSSFGSERQMFSATCAECGAPTKVPFKPSGRPVYCRECFESKR